MLLFVDWAFVAYSMVGGLAFGLIAYGLLWSIDRVLRWMAD